MEGTKWAKLQGKENETYQFGKGERARKHVHLEIVLIKSS